MGELNNQPHSQANSTTYKPYALLFCFSQHKILAFNPCNVLRTRTIIFKFE